MPRLMETTTATTYVLSPSVPVAVAVHGGRIPAVYFYAQIYP